MFARYEPREHGLPTSPPGRRNDGPRARAKIVRNSDPDVYLLYRASKEELAKARVSFLRRGGSGGGGKAGLFTQDVFSPASELCKA
jgi:hypothetical protein